MIELNTLMWILIILLTSTLGMSLLAYLEFKEIRRKIMSVRVECRHSDGTYISFTTDEPFEKVQQELVKRNGEIVSFSWTPITYKGKEINV